MSTLARIAVVALNGRRPGNVEGNRKRVLELLDQALKIKPDLVALPETFTTSGMQEGAEKHAESLDGPTLDTFSKKAREHRCYVVCPIWTKRENKLWNSAVLLDRKGEIAGIYDKVFPVTTSPDYTLYENGVQPGQKAPVLETDFGKIGLQICFDINFPETWQSLADQGARLVCWLSAYPGGFPLRAHAWTHKYYVATSVQVGPSKIINPCGDIISETEGLIEMTWQDINLDYVIAHSDFNYPVPDRILAKYGDRVKIHAYQEEGVLHIEPRDSKITCKQLQAEFGFEPYKIYLDRHIQGLDKLRNGCTASPQQAAHGIRAQYSK